MKIVYKYFLFTMVLSLFSCGGSGDDPAPDPDPDVPAPKAATLVFPNNNEECTEGVLVSDTESLVTFEWTAAQNTDTYMLILTNLESGEERSSITTNSELEVTLERGTAYSWYIISRANGTNETALSTTWRFYNAGVSVVNHAPFPPYEPFPQMGLAVNAGNITLKWNSADLDGDALTFTLYLDTISPPTTILGETDSNSFNATLDSNTIYYWQVVAADGAGNNTRSEIFEFRTKP